VNFRTLLVSLLIFFLAFSPAHAAHLLKIGQIVPLAKTHTESFPTNFSDPDGLEALTYGQRGTTNAPSYNINNLPGNAQNAAIAGAVVGLALETAPTAGLAIEYIGIRAGVSLISRTGALIYAGSQAVGRALEGGYVCPPIRFGGRGDNQKHHIQKHMDEVGASYEAVQSAVIKDIAYRLKGNFTLGHKGQVVVDGQTFEYRPYLLPDGSINVGTTFRVK
jgi:hypothetical protein